MEGLNELFARVNSLLDRLEKFLPETPAESPDWSASHAFRWLGVTHATPLKPIVRPNALPMEHILCVDAQKFEIGRNTLQFLAGLPANNVLLWGAKGTGKSSLIKSLLHEYGELNLRMVEIDRQHLLELPDILELLAPRPEKFILFCDDLSFDSGDAGYKALKALLEGSLSAPPANVLIYATSNRRHLLPEYHKDNKEAHWVDDELHQGESVEEKISLSERFGIWLSFHPFTQDQYLSVVNYWLTQFGGTTDADLARSEALRYALLRGSRSGRVAWQFAKDFSGRQKLAVMTQKMAD